jgi:hypothetical protein
LISLAVVVSRAPQLLEKVRRSQVIHPFYRTAHAFAATSRASVPSAHTLSELPLTAAHRNQRP